MKSIHTLIIDIQHLVTTRGWVTDELAREYSDGVARRLRNQYNSGTSETKGIIRLSKLGPSCPRAYWYSIHHPELAEPLPPWAEVKFSTGHCIEALAIMLAKASGHTVEGEQDELTVDGITGHRDCIIDGCLVDIKSQSTRAIEKLRTKTLAQDDPFGYLDQLDGYSLGSLYDDLVKIKDKAYILGIDKTLGHMILYSHECRHEQIRERIKELRRIANLSVAPSCACRTKPEGASGNIGLDVKASYNPYKHQCFPHLRTFLYASGPVYLVKVVREPNVTEIKKSF